MLSLGEKFSGLLLSAYSRIKIPQTIAKQIIRQILSTFFGFFMNFQRNSFHLLFCGHYDNNYIVFIGFTAATVLLMWHIFIFKNRSLGGLFLAPQVSRKGRMLRRVIGTANCERKGKRVHPVQYRMVMRTGNSFGQQCYSLSHHLLPLYPII